VAAAALKLNGLVIAAVIESAKKVASSTYTRSLMWVFPTSIPCFAAICCWIQSMATRNRTGEVCNLMLLRNVTGPDQGELAGQCVLV